MSIECDDHLREMLSKLEGEREYVIKHAQDALESYRQQYQVIEDAVADFTSKYYCYVLISLLHDLRIERTQEYANDFIQREQCITKCFLHYIMSIFSSMLLTVTSNSTTLQQPSIIGWECKFVVDRFKVKSREFHHQFSKITYEGFDLIATACRDKVKYQFDYVINKISTIMNDRLHSIDQRKLSLRKRLLKHANQVCGERLVL